MRTTIDLPDALFRKTKRLAAMRGSSMKDLIVQIVERELSRAKWEAPRPVRAKLPLVRLRRGRTLDLTNFNFDDLLA